MAHETLAIVRLVSNTGLPADSVEMQFAFRDASDNGGGGGFAADIINTFLNTTFAGAGTLSSFLAGSLNHSVLPQVDSYDISGVLGGGHRGSPIHTANLSALDTPTVDTDLPLQAAIGLSYHADLDGIAEFGAVDPAIPTDEAAVDEGAPATHSGITRPKARRRGRIFFGPLNEGAMKSTGLRLREPDDTFVTVATNAMTYLAGHAIGWSVWSRRSAALHQVNGGWVANETDVVRRRRLKATTRTLWP